VSCNLTGSTSCSLEGDELYIILCCKGAELYVSLCCKVAQLYISLCCKGAELYASLCCKGSELKSRNYNKEGPRSAVYKSCNHLYLGLS